MPGEEERMVVSANPWDQSISEAIVTQGEEHAEVISTGESVSTGTEGAAEQTQEENHEATPSQDDFQLPEWLKEDFRPTRLDTDATEFDGYKRAYENVIRSITTPEFLDALTEQYKEQLTQTDQELLADRERFLAMRQNPKEYVRLHMPEVAAELGIQLRTTEEMNEAVEEKMTAEFGENWNDMFDPTEQFKIGSLSYNILQKHREFLGSVEAEQASAQEKYNEQIKLLQTQKTPSTTTPANSNLTEQELRGIIEEEFEAFKQAGISRDDYNKFVTDLPSQNIGVYEMWLALNIDKVRQQERELGRQEGRKGIVGDLKKAGRAKDEVIKSEQPKQEEKTVGSFKDDYYRRQNGFGI